MAEALLANSRKQPGMGGCLSRLNFEAAPGSLEEIQKEVGALQDVLALAAACRAVGCARHAPEM